MNMPIAGTITPNSMTLIVDGLTNVLTPASHRNYDAIRDAWKAQNMDRVRSLLDLTSAITGIMDGRVSVEHGVVSLDGENLHNAITTRIIEQHAEGFDASSMCNFLANLEDNPSKQAVDELYLFLEAGNLPITEDGCFLAYKMVREDYTDHYTGKFDNSVGKTPKMKRNKVDDRRDVTCSDGLHFCSQGYLHSYHSGGRVMLIKINPRDVVSIPSDYKNAKGRCCQYEVVGEVDRSAATPDHSFDTSVMTDARLGDGGVLTDDLQRPFEGQFIAKRVVAQWFNVPTYYDLIDWCGNNDVETTEVNGKKVIVWHERYIEDFAPDFDDFLDDPAPASPEVKVHASDDSVATTVISDLGPLEGVQQLHDGDLIAKRLFIELFLNDCPYAMDEMMELIRANEVDHIRINGKVVIIFRDRYVEEYNW